jgi:hypothetical protein
MKIIKRARIVNCYGLFNCNNRIFQRVIIKKFYENILYNYDFWNYIITEKNYDYYK